MHRNWLGLRAVQVDLQTAMPMPELFLATFMRGWKDGWVREGGLEMDSDDSWIDGPLN